MLRAIRSSGKYILFVSFFWTRNSFVSVFYVGHETRVKICLCVMWSCEMEFCIKLSRVPFKNKKKKDLLLLKYKTVATTCSSATLFLCG